MHKRYVILWALVAAVMVGLYGCESSTEEPIRNEAQWVQLGWEAIVQGLAANDADTAENFFETAHMNFGNAYKIDTTYAPAYNGDGWTFIYEHQMESALDYFENGVLYGGGLADSDPHKRMLYIGGMVAAHALDNYTTSVTYGLTYDNMDPNRNFQHPYDSSFTAFDALMFLALDYFALGDQANVTYYINELCEIVGDPPWTFTDWVDCATKIADLAGKDPS